MNKNDIFEKIIKLGGDCFKAKNRPPCGSCPFQKQCLQKIILLAENIPKETRVQWALDELVEEFLLDDKE